MIVSLQQTSAASVTVGPVANFGGLSSSQRTALLYIARDTWKFYSVDVDAVTHLPMDNVTFAGGSATARGYGRYTSASDVGVYLWAVVAADDLGLIGRPEAQARIQATLSEVAQLQRFDGFLYQWYDTTTGHVIRNPGDIDCTTETTPTFDNCFFVSNVDNGWYASGLIAVRQAMPELRHLVHKGIFLPTTQASFLTLRRLGGQPGRPVAAWPRAVRFGCRVGWAVCLPVGRGLRSLGG